MGFTTALQNVKQTVDRQLLQFFSEKHAEANKIHPQTIQFVDAIADFTSRGGKRTRAFLVWLGHQSVIPAKAGIQSAKNWIPDQVGDDNLLHAMMGIELFQSFALIHDDIIDEDTVRRGGPTVHEKFKLSAVSYQRSAIKATHFGESMAILAGDLALVWADELINNIQYPISNDQFNRNAKRIVDPSHVYQKMKHEVLLGQCLDVLAVHGLPSADRATINRYKTAWYTVVRPLQIGAAIAGAEKQTIEAFVPYGLAVGEGYQLRDDFLDGAISQDEFDAQSVMLEKQAMQAAQAIHARTNIVALLTDFAGFALIRKK